MAREIEVDWQSLHNAFVVHHPNSKSFLSLIDGSVVRVAKNSKELRQHESDTDNFRTVGIVPSPIQYVWLNTFIGNIEDSDLQDSLQRAIDGKGAFRRFKDALSGHEQVRRAWFEYRDQSLRQWLQDWLLEQGVKASNVPPWVQESAESENTDLKQDIHAMLVDYPLSDEQREELSEKLLTGFRIQKI